MCKGVHQEYIFMNIYNKASNKSIPNDSGGNIVRLKLSRLTLHRLGSLGLGWRARRDFILLFES